MHLPRTLFLFVIFAGELIPAMAQKQKAPADKPAAAVNSLFGDLPIDDAAGNSVLSKGESADEKIRKNILVVGSLNKYTCYTGEPVLLTYQLYSAVQSKSLIVTRPVLSDFNTEERPVNNEQPYQKKIDGRDYRVFTIYQAQLNPLHPGNWDIDPLTVDNEVSYTSDNKTYSYSGTVNSKPVRLTVLPLPEKQRPEGFSGAIGKFQFRAAIGSGRIAAGETDTLRLEIEGAGNLNDITTPVIKWPAGFEAFSSKEKWVPVKNAFPPAGKKKVLIPFIAHQEGRFTIPSIRFSYFDPAVKAYVELQSGEIVLNILPSLSGGLKKPAVSAPPVADPATQPVWMRWLLAALAIVAALGVLVVGRLRKRVRASGGAQGEAFGKEPEPTSGGSSEVVFGSASGSPAGKEPGPASESPAGTAPMSEAERTAILAANARKELEGLDGVQDAALYIVDVRTILGRFLQEKLKTKEISGDGLAEALYRNTQDRVLAEEVRKVYSHCNRLLYSPADWAGGDGFLLEGRSMAGTGRPFPDPDASAGRLAVIAAGGPGAISLVGAVRLIIDRCEFINANP